MPSLTTILIIFFTVLTTALTAGIPAPQRHALIERVTNFESSVGIIPSNHANYLALTDEAFMAFLARRVDAAERFVADENSYAHAHDGKDGDASGEGYDDAADTASGRAEHDGHGDPFATASTSTITSPTPTPAPITHPSRHTADIKASPGPLSTLWHQLRSIPPPDVAAFAGIVLCTICSFLIFWFKPEHVANRAFYKAQALERKRRQQEEAQAAALDRYRTVPESTATTSRRKALADPLP
ncbi:MAG: hypothetical protein Q9183_007294, partial [Haloplaca sp. 2 TL-2023]